MELTWLDPDRPDQQAIADAVALLEGARSVDTPYRLQPSVSSWIGRLRHGWDGDPPIAAVAREGGGRAVAFLELSVPRWDNVHIGVVRVTVDPLVRRRGIGRRLAEAAFDRLRADGRTLALAESFDQPPGMAFARAMGFEAAAADVMRRQDLTAVDWARLDERARAAEGRAAGYELVRMPGPTPEHMLADIARMTEAINDAPTDDLDVEDEVFSPERIRMFEAAQLGQARRLYRVVARERATGDLAGHTMVGVDAERPWHGWQFDTSVSRAHRGHRLGLLLKIEMLRWLAEAEPQLRAIVTGNAASNDHMIAVNELLGYEIESKSVGWQRKLG